MNPKDNLNKLGREDGRSSSAEAGLYRHPLSGEEAGTIEDPLFGNAQSEAFVRAGFVRVGDLPEGYVKDTELAYLAGAGGNSGSAEDLKGIQARLTLMEKSQQEAAAASATDPSTLDTDVREAAKADGIATVINRTGVSTDPLAGVPSDKPLAKMNKNELLAVAESKGLTVDSSSTNKQLIEAITSAE